MSAPAILIVEDEAVVALDLSMQLEDLGYVVAGTLPTAEAAIAHVAQQPPDLILMDIRLRGVLDGVHAAQHIRRDHDVPVIFLTSHADDHTVERAARTAPYGYLTKPYQIRELRAGIEVALTKVGLERQLRESDRWFTQTLHCVQDGVVLTTPDARVRFLNPAAEQMTGWPREEAQGRPLAEVLELRREHADICPGAEALAACPDSTALALAVLRLGRPLSLSHGSLVCARGGHALAVDDAAGPVLGPGGETMGAVLLLRDAAPRLAQEAQLRSSQERFRNAFDFAPLGMALVSPAGRLLQVNAALCTLLGADADELLAAEARDWHDEPGLLLEQQRLLQLLAGQQPIVQFELALRPLDGREPVPVLVSASLLQERDESPCFLYQLHDLSAQKKAAQQMAELAQEKMRRQAAEMAERTRAEFLSRASHELRTPLNAVMGFAALLKMPAAADPAKTARYGRHIEAAGRHLLTLVEDVLDLQRAAQKNLPMQLAPVELAAAVTEVVELLEPQAAAHQVQLHARVASGPRVVADATRLRQVLLNLGSNAIKYNRPGGEVRFASEDGAAGTLCLAVEDTGIGMNAEQLQRLFQPFDRLGREGGSIPGTGLGLVIARALVEQMGGQLEVTSREQGGTQVHLRLQRAGGGATGEFSAAA